MDLISLISAYRDILVVIAATLAILFYIAYTNWDAVKLWWKGVKYHNFLFGKLRKLAKNPDVKDKWFHSESAVCQDYNELYGKIHKDGDYYEACKKYLSIVGESGRKPLAAIMMIGLFAVLVLEAWGFSYTMSGFIDLSASENTRVVMTWIVAIAFAVILAFLTHLMGHEIYRNGILGRIRNNWKADSPETRPKTLDAIQFDYDIEDFSDDNQPNYMRRLYRLDVNSPVKKHTFTIAAVIAIVAIGIIITFVRIKTLQVAQTQDVMCIPGESAASAAGGLSLDALYSDTPPPPQAAQQAATEARERGETEICQATKEGSWATFGMLAILFLVLQAFATWVSYKYGFVGKHSKTAWQSTHKYKTKSQYEMAMDSAANNIAQRAQKTLSELQSRMAKKLSGETMNSSVDVLINTAAGRTFWDYVEQDSDQSLASRNRRARTTLGHEQEHSSIMTQATVAEAPMAAAAAVASAVSAPSTDAVSDDELERQLLAEAKAASDAEIERQLLEEAQQAKQETPEEQKARIMAKLKAEGKL
ncbi:cell envelope integrity protein TolA [Marinomonas ostreistagni]|uniref:cell envelope integrity protein TolA n=1 Tax=Marinomonas ostreistagni TaxID=359209 RepID=UPI0019513248|nr:cell envelope integrity protein TolA [Marinomonas ostreistagni]MBM6551848.1 cell envelope integrity protein TolA [Marinomonas ostreistagni]